MEPAPAPIQAREQLWLEALQLRHGQLLFVHAHAATDQLTACPAGVRVIPVKDDEATRKLPSYKPSRGRDRLGAVKCSALHCTAIQ